MIIGFMLSFSNIVEAKDNSMEVLINNNKTKVRKVDVLVNNSPLKSEVPSFIIEDRTLVPARFVAETFGAKVEWDQITKTATIISGTDVLELMIDKDTARANGKDIPLDLNSVPRLVQFSNDDARTMVPLAFIAESLDYDYGYDKAKSVPYINSDKKEEPEKEKDPQDAITSSQITDIVLSKGSSNSEKLIIKGNSNLKYDKVSNKGENISIKLTGVSLSDNANKKIASIKNENIKQVKAEKNGNDLILNITLNGTKDYIVNPINSGKELSVGFVDKVNNLREENGKIYLDNAGKLNRKVMRLSNPDRIVVDILDAELLNNKESDITKKVGYIDSVRISNFVADGNYKPEDNIVRMVFDIAKGNEKKELKFENQNGTLVVMPEESVWDFIEYSKTGRIGSLNILNGKTTEYNVTNDSQNRIIEISIPKSSSNLKEGSVMVNDSLINKIDIKESGNQIKVIIKYMRTVDFEILSNKKTDKISLKLVQDSNIKPEDRVIVLDAGHGGKDPGTSSDSGTKEKDVVLDVTLKLEDKLKSYGYSPLMTRRDDTYIGLYDRANLANDNNADIFISVHANSIKNKPSVSGIETLYCPKEKGKGKTEDQHPLAKTIQDNLIKDTKAVNRSTKQRPDLAVLNSTKMPAALIELGFLTNPNEENLLKSEEYQNKLADSIANSIKEYFEIY